VLDECGFGVHGRVFKESENAYDLLLFISFNVSCLPANLALGRLIQF